MAEEMDIEEGDLDLDMDDGPTMEMPNLFWSMTVNPDGDNEIEEPEVQGWAIHITHACFGTTVKPGSRTVVIAQHDDNENNKEAPLCVLLEGKNENVRLDLLFSEPAKFILQGKNPSPVSLTGYLQPPPGFGDETPSMMGEDLAEIEDDEEEAQIHDLIRKRKLSEAKKDAAKDDEAPQLIKENKNNGKPQEPPAKRAKTEAGNNKQQQKNTPKNQKNENQTQAQTQTQTQTQDKNQDQNKNKKNANKNKKKNDKTNENNNTTSTNVDDKDKETKEEAEETTDKQTNKDVNSKTQQTPKESEKTEKQDEKTDAKQDENKNKKQDKTDKMQTMKGGIQYKDLKQGEGEPIQNGQKVRVYYVGQLDDKTIFDKVITGHPFEFEYGKGSVVKGWDLGMKGMKIGGKRRIVIPAKLGYGQQAMEKIPANSTLTYTVEIKSAN